MTALWLALLVGNAEAAPIPVGEGTVWNEGYFPKGIFGERTDDFVAKWYRKHLAAMGEPSLKDAVAAKKTVVRFLWLRTWGEPIAVRLEVTPTSRTLFAVRLDGSGGYEPGGVKDRVARPVTEAEWASVEKVLAEARYTELPVKSDVLGLDGAQWVLEAVIDGEYHLVERWSPEKDGDQAAFRKACWAILELAGLKKLGDVY